ncbi:MAG: hypothetical protein WDO56_13205 [Gammaproteobacteria bacterium]
MAASVAVGAVVALLALKSPEASRIGTVGGQLVAQADLADALSNRLASKQPAEGPVQIGLSFKSKVGELCRTFTLKNEGTVGGLACRQGDVWRVQVLASTPGSAAGGGGYRQAGGNLPPAVLAAMEQEITGEPLDAAAESEARSKNWN